MPRVILDSIKLKINTKHHIPISIKLRIRVGNTNERESGGGGEKEKREKKKSVHGGKELVCLASEWALPEQPSPFLAPSLLYPTKFIAPG